jgi:hypothetical protein
MIPIVAEIQRNCLCLRALARAWNGEALGSQLPILVHDCLPLEAKMVCELL